jgi:hypothetical protein
MGGVTLFFFCFGLMSCLRRMGGQGWEENYILYYELDMAVGGVWPRCSKRREGGSQGGFKYTRKREQTQEIFHGFYRHFCGCEEGLEETV